MTEKPYLITDTESVEACSGLCIDPETIKSDALQLMAYSNSRSSLRNRAEYCRTTEELEQNMFSEILNLFVSLALRCRLWKENYRRGELTADIDNIKVGICRRGSKKQEDKPVKILEVLSYVSHAEAFWFDPCEIKDYPTGTNISIKVPPDPNRSSNYLRAIKTVEDSLPSVSTLSATELEILKGTLDKLRSADDSKDKIERIYTINLDEFSCAVSKIIDTCHDCAGEISPLYLNLEDGLPSGW